MRDQLMVEKPCPEPHRCCNQTHFFNPTSDDVPLVLAWLSEQITDKELWFVEPCEHGDKENT